MDKITNVSIDEDSAENGMDEVYDELFEDEELNKRTFYLNMLDKTDITERYSCVLRLVGGVRSISLG